MTPSPAIAGPTRANGHAEKDMTVTSAPESSDREAGSEAGWLQANSRYMSPVVADKAKTLPQPFAMQRKEEEPREVKGKGTLGNSSCQLANEAFTEGTISSL